MREREAASWSKFSVSKGSNLEDRLDVRTGREIETRREGGRELGKKRRRDKIETSKKRLDP